jgi:hypothetical protein
MAAVVMPRTAWDDEPTKTTIDEMVHFEKKLGTPRERENASGDIGFSPRASAQERE